MGLARELLYLICILIFSILLLIINLSLFADLSTSKPAEQKTVSTDTPAKPIQNREGMQLFKENCASCHNRNMRDGMTGPALGGVEERWGNNKDNLYGFIRNSQVVINSGNDYAKAIFEKWKIEMPPFSNLKDEEIETILDYIGEVYKH